MMSVLLTPRWILLLFFFNDTATTEIYTLSLHDALPISTPARSCVSVKSWDRPFTSTAPSARSPLMTNRSEEHTSELQSRLHLVCRLLLEKKKKKDETKISSPAEPPYRPRPPV